MKRILLSSVLIFSMMLMSGCAGLMVGPPANPNNPLKRVALLPLKNDTADVGGPSFVREKMMNKLEKYHYSIKPLEETDQILRDRLGITLGGQLEMASIKALKKELDVEGLLFGTLMDFKETSVGVYNVRKVRGKFKMVNAVTGQTFWENGIGVKCEDGTNDAAGVITSLAAGAKDKRDKEVPWISIPSYAKDEGAGKNLLKSLGGQLLAKATNTHLLRETNEMVNKIMETLPTGPGATASLPALKMPEIEIKMPPPPSIGHMDYGKKNFSAVMETTVFDKERNESFTSKMPIAKAGKKIRLDMDYASMTKGSEMPEGLRKMTTIFRGDKKTTYSLYPNRKKYIEFKETDENYYEKPTVQKTKLGSETIDGHPTDKYKVKITYKNGDVHNGLIWNARDLDGMTIKSITEDDKFKAMTMLKNVKLKTPPAPLFEIPAGFIKARGFMEIAMDEQ